ncbi:hypothetical protein EGT50_14275 [Rhodococcus xishaensis]|uniref:Uncharacterized protein n=1 Tax=Rhodococcus xishaensis TaxID=2487364 RepID=A0A3S3ZI82_9NOCA|nr:hypothetical protein EGT50_14275 [Rhodococcus xishaensis]
MTSYELVDGERRRVRVETCPESGRYEVEVNPSVALLIRSESAALTEGVPIGTRKREHLKFVLDGQSIDLTIGNGGLSRRSYRVKFDYEGREYLFVPVTDDESALAEGSAELARFSIDENGRVEPSWETSRPVTPAESAAGIVLAAALGCGALNGARAFIEALATGTGA